MATWILGALLALGGAAVVGLLIWIALAHGRRGRI